MADPCEVGCWKVPEVGIKLLLRSSCTSEPRGVGSTRAALLERWLVVIITTTQHSEGLDTERPVTQADASACSQLAPFHTVNHRRTTRSQNR